MSEGQKILAISGCKEAGKNTVCNFIHSLVLVFFKCTPQAEVDPETGELIVLTEDGEKGIFDLNNRNPEFIEYMANHVWPFIRKFSFATKFKDACINMFGLPPEAVYGTNEQKMMLTKFKWEDMPLPHPKIANGERDNAKTLKVKNLPQSGFMTAREFMQYFGSQIGREIYNEVWSEAVIRDIEASGSGISLIDDLRFPHEVDAVHKAGGKVIRLTRKVHPEDNHDSEIALDPDRYDWSNFDKVIDNQDMSIEQLTEEVYKTLIEFGWIDEGDGSEA